MHIRKIQLSNIRGFREVDLDLTRPDGSLAGWTVLAGRNGSGKSTLLKAIALAAAGKEVALRLGLTFEDWIRAGSGEASTLLELSSGEPTAPLRWTRNGDPDEPDLHEGEIQEAIQGLREELQTDPQSATTRSLQTLVKQVAEKRFIAAYGPYRRLTGEAPDARRLMAGPVPIARLVSLFREDASLIECVVWLKENYVRKLEEKEGAAELEKAVLDLLGDGLLDGVRVEKFDSAGLWISQNNVRLPFGVLSEGYRTVAALVLDLIRHLHRTFGTLQIEPAADQEGSFLRVLHSGVVLIDEVDNHLHVSWQQRIGFWLKRHFPNIQFIVTTHSPFICQAADPGGLIRLPAPGEELFVEHVSEDLFNTVVHGGLDQAVLTKLFGLQSPYSMKTERLRDAVAHLEAAFQRGKATEADGATLEELRSRLPRTMSSAVEQALRALAVER